MEADIALPNGCVFCGQLERGHCQRYDWRHPAGRNGYTAPTDHVRIVRMRVRRSIRTAALTALEAMK